MSLFWAILLTMSNVNGNVESSNKNEKEQIIDTINHVDLIEMEHFDENGVINRKDYFVYNGNSFPMYVKIHLTKEINVKNELANVSVTVLPESVVELGQVKKDKTDQPADWDYNWTVSRYPL